MAKKKTAFLAWLTNPKFVIIICVLVVVWILSSDHFYRLEDTVEGTPTTVPGHGIPDYVDLFNFASDLKNYWLALISALKEENVQKRRFDVIQDAYRSLQIQIQNFTRHTSLKDDNSFRQKFFLRGNESISSVLVDLSAIAKSVKEQDQVPKHIFDQINNAYTKIHVRTLALMDVSLSSRKATLDRLAKMIQDKIEHLQNPENCSIARLQICDLSAPCGYGCSLHWATNCLMDAFRERRAVVGIFKGWAYSRGQGWNYAFQPVGKCSFNNNHHNLPGIKNANERVVVWRTGNRVEEVSYTIPAQLAPTLRSAHGRPDVWWIAQFVSYLTRYNPRIREKLKEHSDRIDLGKGPIVGLHIRRGDKVGNEAKRFEVEDYMFYVEQWFLEHAMTHKVANKTVFVATDDNTVLPELKSKYPGYVFKRNDKTVAAYNENGLESIVTDVHFLSRADFVVCTFTSNLGRLLYELKAGLDVDAPMKIQSIDDPYHFTNGGEPMVAILNHTDAGGHGDLEFVAGDRLDIKLNDFYRYKHGMLKQEEFIPYHNGFRRAENIKNSKMGKLPVHKIRRTYVLMKYSIFDENP